MGRAGNVIKLKKMAMEEKNAKQLGVNLATTGLSQIGRDALKILADTKNFCSPTAEKCLDILPQDEQTIVMERIVNQLEQVSDWSRRPKGFPGAWLLAQRSPDAAKIFKLFIKEVAWGRKPPWLSVLLKGAHWY